jgi:PTS system nitrogen regulatory IIA component
VEGWIRDEGLPYTRDRDRLLFDRVQVSEWAATRGLAARAGFLAPEKSVLASNLRIGRLLRIGCIWRDVPAVEAPNVFERAVSVLPGVTTSIRQLLSQRLRAKGGVTIAPIGGGFALPHPSARITLGRDAGTVALIFLRDALPLSEEPADDAPVTRLLFFVAPSPRAHLDLLGRLSRNLVGGPLRNLLVKGARDEEIFQAIDAIDAASVEVPKPEVKE